MCAHVCIFSLNICAHNFATHMRTFLYFYILRVSLPCQPGVPFESRLHSPWKRQREGILTETVCTLIMASHARTPTASGHWSLARSTPASTAIAINVDLVVSLGGTQHIAKGMLSASQSQLMREVKHVRLFQKSRTLGIARRCSMNAILIVMNQIQMIIFRAKMRCISSESYMAWMMRLWQWQLRASRQKQRPQSASSRICNTS